jgi:MFS family permease
VSLYPTPNLIALYGSEAATKWLAAASSAGAVTEIAVSPVVGALVDSLGRKPVVICTMLFVAAAFATVGTCTSGALLPLFGLSSAATATVAATTATATATAAGAATSSLPLPPAATAALLVGCKYLSGCVVGFFFLAASAMLADLHRDDATGLSGAMAVLFSLVNLGFGVGVSLSGLLPKELPLPYLLSASLAFVGAAALALAVPETLPKSDRRAFDGPKVRRALLSPISFLRLLRSGPTLRRLTLLTALHSAPIFMGDVMQVFVTTEWALAKSEVVQLFSIVAFTGVISNVAAAAGAIAALGTRGFTALATASNLLFWVSMSLDHRRALAGAVVGFLGPARGLVSGASLASEGAKLGMSQGQIAGDRANLFAILKVSFSYLLNRLFIVSE